jgi:hypothetical protein
MKRQMTSAAITLINSLRSPRPNGLRKAISWMLMTTLTLVPILSGRTPVTPPAQAQTICSGADPNRIFQGCRLGSAFETNLENVALDELTNLHQLPLADRARLIDSQRNELRSLLFGQLRNIIKKTNRTSAENAAVDALAAQVKAKRVESAQFAVEEYNKWLASPCTYRPPDGFNYDGNLLCAAARLNPAVAGPVDPPKFEEFQAYGVARSFSVFKDFKTQKIIDQVVASSAFFGGIAAGGGLGALAAVVVPEALLKALFPFATRAFAIGGGGAAGLGGAAAAVGGAVLIVVVAIVIGTLRGIEVFNAVAIPGKLQAKLDEVRNAAAPDLAQLILTPEGEQEIFSSFILLTLPDFPSTAQIPAAQPSDPKFIVRQEGSTLETISAAINFKSWDNDNQSARLNGAWFINQYREENLDQERWALRIDYINWKGEAWSAGRRGATFNHTKYGDTKTTFQSPEINYRDWNGAHFTARLLLQELSVAVLPVVLDRGRQTPDSPIGVTVPQTLPIARVNSAGQAPNTLSILVNNGTSATTSGVTISDLKIDAEGKVTASLAAECSAVAPVFELKVIDNVNQIRTTSLTVQLTPLADMPRNPLASSLPDGVVGVSYNGVLIGFYIIAGFCTNIGSQGFTVTSGHLPPGLSFGMVRQCTGSGSVQNCTLIGEGLIGQPTAAGVYEFTVRRSYSNGDNFSQAYTVEIKGDPAPLPSGAVSWWSGERGLVDDLKRNHAGAVNISNSDFARGKVGLAFSFDGNNRAVRLPNDFFPFDSAGNLPFSFETWFKTATGGVIIGQQDVDPFNASFIHTPGVYVGVDGKLRVRMFAGGETPLEPMTSANAVNDDAFHHVAVIYDGQQQIAYLDGAEIGRIAHTQSGVDLDWRYQLGTGYGGAWPATNGSWFNFMGLIDEPTLYNRALTLEEVQSIFNAGSVGKMDISITAADPVCGAQEGFIKVEVIGHATPFNYAIDDSDFRPDRIFVVPAGSYQVKIKDIAGRVFTRSVILDNSALSISATDQNFTAQGGTGSFNVDSTCEWQAVSNNPEFITITSPSGGQGTGSGAVNFSVAANNISTRSGTITVTSGIGVKTFTVQQAGPAITATVSGGGTICPGGSGTVSVNLTGGAAPYTVSLSDGQTKTGSSLPITFTVSPTATATYTVLSATDGFGSAATVAGSATFTVNQQPVSLGNYPATSVAQGGSTTIAPSAAPANASNLTVSAPGFTGSLSIDPTTGVVTVGNAGPAGNFTVTIAASNSCESSARTFALAVTGTGCSVTINPVTLNQPALSVPYAQVLTTSQSGSYTYSVSAGSLPPGLSLIKVLGVTSIAGIPTTPGTYNFTLSAARSGSNCVATRSYTLVVPGTVIPLLDCLVRNPNRTYTARFGYDNTTGAVQTIPIGSNNYFTPGKQNRGQATVFQPGRVRNAFSVTFTANGSNLGVWLLRGPDNVLRPVNVTTAKIGCQ